MSIVRIGLAENKGFATGYDAIFKKKSKKPAAAAVAVKAAPAKPTAAAKPTTKPAPKLVAAPAKVAAKAPAKPVAAKKVAKKK